MNKRTGALRRIGDFVFFDRISRRLTHPTLYSVSSVVLWSISLAQNQTIHQCFPGT
ncbi:MAG: hypothetical protein O9350_11495 [Microcystis sp. LE19-388.1G]|uniref:Uncharacterized protein n=1 Tax=Microcystis aeruginosa BLCC-F158 TaxID=2755316 RepID=A0A841V4Z5_MICAE|nr:hypothetical protein [Microcystis aeruginosa]MBC1196064.1 hypothetical protein [Microcystis aeruginosa BLCC-F158]MCZ8358456.1 hypothetical protein [Microcystis sp. LE19-388.1G]